MKSIGASWRWVPSDLRLAATALVAGLLLNVHISSQVTVNGVITSCSYLSFSEILGGAIAVFLGSRLAIYARPGVENRDLGDRARGPVLVMAGVAVALGVLLVLKGLGLVLTSCT